MFDSLPGAACLQADFFEALPTDEVWANAVQNYRGT